MSDNKHSVVFGALFIIGLLAATWQSEKPTFAQSGFTAGITATPRQVGTLFENTPTPTPVRPRNISVLPKTPLVGEIVTISGEAEEGGLVTIFANEEMIKATTANTGQTWLVEITFDQPGEYEIRARLMINGRTISDLHPFTVNIIAPNHTPTPEATAATPTSTQTRSPIVAPLPTKEVVPTSPTATPTEESVLSPQPESPLPPDMAVTLLEPGEGQPLNGKVNFSWFPHYQLPPDHAYQLVFFVRGSDPAVTGLGPVRWTTSTEVTVDMDVTPVLAELDGAYAWTVLLVKTAPEYRLLKSLAHERAFQ